MRLRTFSTLMICMQLWAVLLSAGEKPQPENPAVTQWRERLARNVPLRVNDTTVQRSLEILLKSVDVPLVIRKDVALESKLTLQVDNARAIDILDAICAMRGLRYELHPEGVRFGGMAAAIQKPPEMEIYDLGDLVRGAPDIDGRNEERLANHWGTLQAAGPTLTNIADMIRNRVRPESWDAALGTSIEERGGLLVITQSPAVHAEIRGLLREIRSKMRRQIAIDVRAVNIGSRDVDAIQHAAAGRGVRGMMADKEALAAIEKRLADGTATIAFEGSTVLANGQRGKLLKGASLDYLAELDVNGDIYEPVMRRLFNGTTAYVQPLLNDDGSLVLLDLEFTHSLLEGSPELATVVRPGLSPTPGKPGTITVRRKTNTLPAASAAPGVPPAVPDAAAQPAQPAEAQPQPAVPQGPVEVTDEFDIQSFGPAGAPVPAAGRMQIQLPSLQLSRTRQELLLHSGGTAMVSVPLSGKEELEPGRELLLLVRASTLPKAAPARAAAEAAAETRVAAALKKVTTLALGEMPVPNAAQLVSKETGIPIIIDVAGLDEKLQNSVVMTTEQATWDTMLGAIAEAAGASIVKYPSLVLLTTGAGAGHDVQIRMVDVRQLVATHDDYPLPRHYERKRPDATISQFTADQNGQSLLTVADLQALIRERMFVREFSDPVSAVEESNGMLVLMHRAEVLDRVENSLKALGKKLQKRVMLTTRWAVVNTAGLRAAAGDDLPQVLDAARAEKVMALLSAEGSRDLAAVRLSAFNGQIVHAFGGKSSTRTVGYQASGSLLDPVIGEYRHGLGCELQASLISDEAGAASEIVLTIDASLTHIDDLAAAVDPLKEEPRTPTLPPAPGKVHTPSVRQREVRAAATIPNGGAALFRMQPPEWLKDELAAKPGERVLIAIAQAQGVEE
ncbi:MAG TPA: hypothetical protein VEK08_14645 [Planctomycetota bacterium]|nr:hypothetical protein [Planctomycetota bacterium]